MTMQEPSAPFAGSRPMLARVQELTRMFVTGSSTVYALDKVSLDIGRGEFLSILGPSGCGKSTLLNILAGFDVQTSGSAEFNGRPVSGPSAKRGVVFQDTNALFPWMTAVANVEFGLRSLPISGRERKRRALAALELVRLRDFAENYPRQLSGGMRQLVAIARVIVMEADLLLMDEPFAALDAITRQRMQQQLVEIWRKTSSSILFITHSIDEAIYLGDRVVIMSARPGRVSKVLDINFSRPRELASPEFNALRAEALASLEYK
jgi:NitT/TauT family transport system ATP-binding protein